MGDFTDKMAMGTSRMNPSKMLPGSTGNAPQKGLGTQKGTVAALLRSNPSLAGTRTGAVPSAPNQNPLAQSLPLSAAKPFDEASQMTGSGATPRLQLPMQPNAGIPFGENDYRDPRVSSAKGGPTPIQHIPTGNWWENAPGTAPQEQTPDSSMFGPWVLNNEPMRKTQTDLPTETQQMLPNKSDKKSSYKKEDFQLLSDVFKTLSER